MRRKQITIAILVVAVIVAAFLAYFLFTPKAGDMPALGLSSGSNVTIDPQDRTMGDPKAPITMVEYAAPTCPHCAAFNEQIFPKLKEKYIDTGKVFFVFRVFPLNAVDLAAEALARCVPREGYFHFIDLLFRNQDKWSPEYMVADVKSGLTSMARIAGMGSEQADRCMQDKTQLDRANQVGMDGQKRYNIGGTPAFVVNGRVHGGGYDWEGLQKDLDAMLKES